MSKEPITAATLAMHTPGPWRGYFQPSKTFAGLGSLHVILEGDPRTVPSIASIHGTMEPGQDMANARLIAAAPDLLESLRDLTEWAMATSPQLGPTSRPEMLARISAAYKSIAKAMEG